MHELGYRATRTIYRNDVLLNGVIVENRITAHTEGYSLVQDTPDTFANLPSANQAECQPGIAFHNRLFNDRGQPLIGSTDSDGNVLSFCNLLGVRMNAHVDGSIVPGLQGFTRDVPAE